MPVRRLAVALIVLASLLPGHPVRNLPGNHEHVGVARKDRGDRTGDYAKGMYPRRLGPLSYAFRYGPCHFLALDGTTRDPQGKSGYRDRLPAAGQPIVSRPTS